MQNYTHSDPPFRKSYINEDGTDEDISIMLTGRELHLRSRPNYGFGVFEITTYTQANGKKLDQHMNFFVTAEQAEELAQVFAKLAEDTRLYTERENKK